MPTFILRLGCRASLNQKLDPSKQKSLLKDFIFLVSLEEACVHDSLSHMNLRRKTTRKNI